jgi:hypothetical protein
MQPVETWAGKATTSEGVERAWKRNVASSEPAADFDSLMNSTLKRNADSAEENHGASSESRVAHRPSEAASDRASSSATVKKSHGQPTTPSTSARRKRSGTNSATAPDSPTANDSGNSSPTAQPLAISLSLPISVRGPLFLAPNAGPTVSEANNSNAVVSSSSQPDTRAAVIPNATTSQIASANLASISDTSALPSSQWAPANQTGWMPSGFIAASAASASSVNTTTSADASTAQNVAVLAADAAEDLPATDTLATPSPSDLQNAQDQPAAGSADLVGNMPPTLLARKPTNAASLASRPTDDSVSRPAIVNANTAPAKDPGADKLDSAITVSSPKELAPPALAGIAAQSQTPFENVASTLATAGENSGATPNDSLPFAADRSRSDPSLNEVTVERAFELATSIDGTGVASTMLLMKNSSETNKVAGPSMKLLPVGDRGDAVENNLPTSAVVSGTHGADLGTNLNLGFADGNHASNEETTRVLNSLDLPSLADARLRALDRTHDMMALQSMRLVESKMDALTVVIKPAIGTELSLDLRQLGEGVEARATLVRGDHQFLSEHWSDLQERLEQRGIKLGELNYGSDVTNDDQHQSQRQQANENDAAQQASAFAEFAATSPGGGASAHLATVHDGWESWA